PNAVLPVAREADTGTMEDLSSLLHEISTRHGAATGGCPGTSRPPTRRGGIPSATTCSQQCQRKRNKEGSRHRAPVHLISFVSNRIPHHRQPVMSLKVRAPTGSSAGSGPPSTEGRRSAPRPLSGHPESLPRRRVP